MDRSSPFKSRMNSLYSMIKRYGAIQGSLRGLGIAYTRLTSDIDGNSIFDEQWDVCIILDACRADELQRFADHYDWLQPVGRYPSLASCTWNWVPETLAATPAKMLAETTYVTANSFVGELTEEGTFGNLDKVYEYAWDDDLGTVKPDVVTDQAIHHWRKDGKKKMTIHYLQPHVPFLTKDSGSIDRENFEHNKASDFDAWERVTRGDLNRNVAIERYRSTLKCVLESVDLLLSSIDAQDVVITADHGEAFGERAIYGHPPNVGLPCLVEVPWVKTTATDRGDYEPDQWSNKEKKRVSTQEQLRALGYAERRKEPGYEKL